MKTHEPQFEDRIRFNWGYHDAAFDVHRGNPRLTGSPGQQSLTYVSRQHDIAYYEGYIRGVADAKTGVCTDDSTAAWQAYRELTA